MRSPQEIAFRLSQESNNIRLWLLPPSPKLSAPSPLPGLPDPGPVIEKLRDTQFAAEVIGLADLVLQGRYPLLGTVHDLGTNLDWRRDFISGRTSDVKYWRLVPYLDASQVGDHKVIWELNRHQFLIVLAQAYRFTGERKYLASIEQHLTTWLEQNPFMRGINWCSALEIAFRALSWVWVHHLAGGDLNPELRGRLLTALFHHGCYLEHNLSVYFSPNTHLLGEAVVLHALGVLFPDWPRSRQWTALGRRVTVEQLDSQMNADGSHFEQSSYYHVYAMDFFLLHWLLAKDNLPARTEAMTRFLDALLGPGRSIPLIGDDDGGRLFHPYGDGRQFGRATLASFGYMLGRPEWLGHAEDLWPQAAWWMGVEVLTVARPSRGFGDEAAQVEVFRDTGLVVFNRTTRRSRSGLSNDGGGLQVIFDAGPFGRGSGGHSHGDTLSVIVRYGDDEILIDPGTFTYVADLAERERFRGTAAHNTVKVGGRDQATPATPFRWTEKPEVQLVSATADGAEAVCKASHYTHTRTVRVSDESIVIDDRIEGDGPIEQFWHAGLPVERMDARTFRIGDVATLVVAENGSAEVIEGWRSTVYGQKTAAPVIRFAAAEKAFTTEIRW